MLTNEGLYDFRRKQIVAYFQKFAEYHLGWLMELVSKYKARGNYPLLPVQIADYYTDRADKEIAMMSALVMDWGNRRIGEQVRGMRELMGDSPTRWFMDREYSFLSVGRRQKETLSGSGSTYWKIARLYERLYELCYDGRGLRLPSDVFAHEDFGEFCASLGSEFHLGQVQYIAGVMLLALCTDDGIGRGIWPKRLSALHGGLTCPKDKGVRAFVKMWFRDRGIPIDDAIAAFGMKNDYDVWYAYLAWKELGIRKPRELQRYANLYAKRWNFGRFFVRFEWAEYLPEIEFE